MSDQAEIITRPPSHPLATSLLAASILGTIGAIAFVWMELFGEYMPAPPPGAALSPWEQAHNPVVLAQKEQRVHDHYKLDFNDNGEILAAIEQELGVSSRVGDPSIAAEAPGGGGESPPPEAPPGDAPPAGEAPPGEAPPPEEGGGEEGGG